MPAKVDALVLRVEAVLFASGKPVSVAELTETLHLSDFRPVQSALRALQQVYRGRQTAVELKRVGDRYALQLKEEFVPAARSSTPTDLPPRSLKALTLIAYHQPILQSRLARMFGETAYEEVARLRDAGFVHAEPHGATLELRTTRAFAEYFGISSTKPEEVRAFLESKLGVSPTPSPEAGIDASTTPAAQGDVAPQGRDATEAAPPEEVSAPP